MRVSSSCPVEASDRMATSREEARVEETPQGKEYDRADLEGACVGFLRTLVVIEVVFKVVLGLYFYCVAASYEHAACQFADRTLA